MRRPNAPRYGRRRLVALLGALAVLALAARSLALLGGGDDEAGRAPTPGLGRAAAGEGAAHASPPPTRRSLAGIPLDRWVARGEARLSRSEVSAAALAGVAYVVGGFTGDARTSAAVERLDLRSGRWSVGSPLPKPLNHMSAVSYGGALYVVGGYSRPGDVSAGALRDFWRFDPADLRWTAMPPAPLARAAAGAAVLGHRLYVAGGRSDTRATIATTAIFDFQAGRWSIGPPLHHAREHVAAVAAAGAVWLLGGRALGRGNFADVERLRPGDRAWRRMAPMPVARSGFQAVAAGGRVIVVGGEDAATTLGEVDALAPASGRWSRLSDLPLPRHGLGLVADGPLVFAIEGGPRPGLTTSRAVHRLRVA